ncbi:hypothetical protein SDC9_202838 [bioreactor metagenome]|uniref:Uncharacterized protein n=1 Tax=bioreactor metagenome TaxID=1076179 RepID=A0A645IXJ4_9ZZZZ
MQGQALGTQQRLHVLGRRKGPLAVDVGAAVQLPVEDVQRHVGHADFIEVGEAEGEPREAARLLAAGLRYVLANGVPFAADIPRRLAHLPQNAAGKIDSGHACLFNLSVASPVRRGGSRSPACPGGRTCSACSSRRPAGRTD